TPLDALGMMRCNGEKTSIKDRQKLIVLNAREHAMTHMVVDHSSDGAAADVGEQRLRRNRNIGVVIFDGFSLFAAGAVFEVFEVANE
ncbi:hypothetical protein SB690_20270, partial [Bacillus sp. SIMBA_006]|uniref:hypothetical protein n=1 Tax=Bacillus sp. SIMBA_006 TaxID=3085755 RepID=UPI00397D04ED